jgi:hypothetical protein
MALFQAKRSPKSFAGKLSNAAYYEAAIEKLHKKFAADTPDKLHEEHEGGYSFTQVFYDKKKIAKILAKDISGGTYKFSPAFINKMHVGGKLRDIYGFTLFDRIAHVAMYSMLAEDMQNIFPAEVYSYTKGKDRTDAFFAFMNFVRKHRNKFRIPTARGMYVYRFDIKSYGESIPVNPHSVLWHQWEEIFGKIYGQIPSARELELLKEMIRPVVLAENDGLYENVYGIPDGAPITSVLLNLYVGPLDRHLASIKGAFYARYGDDIIFAHENAELFNQAITEMGQILDHLKLRRNVAKTKQIFFNGAGRPRDDFKGSTIVEYLGMELNFNGTAALKKEKIELLMQDIRQRMRGTANILHSRALDEQGKIVCEVVNKTLDPHYPLANPYAVFLRKIVNHRGQLREMDYRIARLVLHTLTGDASVKKFRAVPYKKLRREWGLISLEYMRNK